MSVINLSGITDLREAIGKVYSDPKTNTPYRFHDCVGAASIIDTTGNKQYIDVPEVKMIFRSDGKYIGNGSEGLTIVQPEELASDFLPLMNTGMIDMSHGTVLKDGNRLVLVANVKNSETEIAKGDSVKLMITMFTGFDGSLKHGMGGTNIRIVCDNTLAMAIKAGIQYMFKHTKNIRERIDNAKEAITSELEAFKETIELYRSLATKKMNDSQQKAYVRRVVLGAEKFADTKAEISTRTNNTIEDIIGKLDNERNMVPAIRGTAWQAYNAVTEYLSHDYGRTEENRIDANLFGVAAQKNIEALNLAMEM